MKKRLSYLAGTSLSLALIAGSIGFIRQNLPERPLEVQQTISVQVEGTNGPETFNLPVYREINESPTPLCAKYARHLAKDRFGKTFAPGDAWNLQHRNNVVSQVGAESLESLANNGILRPGMIIGTHNPDSRYNQGMDERGNPIEYTHVVVYIGNDATRGQPLFADQWYDKTRVQSEAELRQNGLTPIEIIDSKR